MNEDTIFKTTIDKVTTTCYKTKTVYITKDGKRHDTPEEAQRHTENQIYDIICGILRKNKLISEVNTTAWVLLENRTELYNVLCTEHAFEAEETD
jgi:lipopolysaccharide biosynthesis glycosyltransferase